MYWQQVWLGVLNADRMTRYCLLLQEKHSTKQQWLDWALAVPVVAAIVTLAIPLTITAEVSVLSVVFTIISALVALNRRRNHALKATRAGIVAAQYTALTVDWKRLWYGSETNSESLAILQERHNAFAAHLDDKRNRKLNLEAEQESDAHISAELRASTA